MAPPDNHTDNELLLLVSRGDEAAFARLMEQYANLLATHIFRITHQREQTEEIVQDVFLKIWQTRESLAEVRNFRVYLYVISRNRALNALRSMIRERLHLKELERQGLVTGAEAGLNDQQEQLGLLEKAIAQLPPQQQKAWLLSRREGLKYRDIALEMGLSEKTVKKHIQYASQSITRYIETHISLILSGLFMCLS